MNNFKIRVRENIGERSVKCFGAIGNELEVTDKEIIDLEDFSWHNNNVGFNDIDEVNELFSEDDEWQTVFELVEVSE